VYVRREWVTQVMGRGYPLINPGDLVYTCLDTYRKLYRPFHDLGYPYGWLPFRMQLVVMDILKLLAGFGHHSEY
jgi:hypothetical protein